MTASQKTSDQCKNCGQIATEKYCANCGQKTSIDRFDWQHIGRQILDSIDLDRGFARTLYQLIVQPGASIRKYINGGRIGFANPFKLFLIIGAFTNVLTFEYKTFSYLSFEPPNLEDIIGFYRYSTKYFSFFTFTAIPLFSFFSWMAFYKRPYNLIEHYILNLYIGVGQFLILIIFVPIINYGESAIALYAYGALNFMYNFWVLLTFFRITTLRDTIKIIAAISIPLAGGFYYNYLIYRISPQSMWTFLDRILA